MAGSLGDMIMQIFGRGDPKDEIIRQALQQSQPPAPPPTSADDGTPVPQPGRGKTVVQDPIPEAMKSPPDLAQMYLKLMERSQNAAALDSGLTTIAAGFAQPQNQQALLQMAASGSKGMSLDMTDIINMRNAAAKEQQLANRSAQLPALMKQYNLDPATVQYLDSTDALDEVVSALANPDTEVFEAADKSKKLINSKTGETIKELSPKAPRATEFVELGDKSKVLVYSDDKTKVSDGKPLTEIKAGQDIQVIQDSSGANVAYDKNSNKVLGKITEGDPNKGDWTLERADGSSARYNSKNELIKELSPAKVDRQFVTDQKDDSVHVVENGKIVGKIIDGDPNKGDYSVVAGNGEVRRYSKDNKLIATLADPKIDRVFRDGPDGSTVMIEDGVVKGTVIEGDPRKGDYTVKGSDGSEIRFDKNNNQIKVLTKPTELNADDKDHLATINKERAAAGEQPMSTEEFLKMSKAGTSVYVDTGGNKIPAPPTDMTWKMDKDGKVIIGEDGAPIAIWVKGSKGEQEYLKTKAENEKNAAAAKKAEESGGSLHERDVMSKASTFTALEDSIGILNQNKDEWTPAAGMGAGALSSLGIGGLPVNNLLSKLSTITANEAFEQLKAMRASAAESGATSGASGLGQVTEKEHKMLSAVWGDVSINQEPAQLKDTLKRIRRAMNVLATTDFPDTAQGMADFKKAVAGYEDDPEPQHPSYNEPDEDAPAGPPKGAKTKKFNRKTGKSE